MLMSFGIPDLSLLSLSPHVPTCLSGIIRKILASRFWLPFSRLSYQIYLIHFLVIYYHFLRQRKPIYFNHYDHLFATAAVIVISLFLSYASFLVFEAPFATLMKLVVAKLTTKTDSSSPNPQEVSMRIVTVATCDNLSFVSCADQKLCASNNEKVH